MISLSLIMVLCMMLPMIPAYAAETHNLPSEYKELEYVESDGNQFIDTGIPFNSKLVVDVTFQVTIPVLAGRGGGAGIVGAYSGGGNANGCIQFAYKRNESDTAFTTRIGTLLCNDPAILPKDTNKHSVTLDCPGGKIIFDGKTVASKDPAEIKIDDNSSGLCNMLISAANFSETTTEITKFGIGASKIFSVTFKKDGAVIADFVPAKRVSDGIVGMYETVGKKFYTNAYPEKTDVSFIAGPEIVVEAPATGPAVATGSNPKTGDGLVFVAIAAAAAVVLSAGTAILIRKKEN